MRKCQILSGNFLWLFLARFKHFFKLNNDCHYHRFLLGLIDVDGVLVVKGNHLLADGGNYFEYLAILKQHAQRATKSDFIMPGQKGAALVYANARSKHRQILDFFANLQLRNRVLHWTNRGQRIGSGAENEYDGTLD